MYLLYYLFLFPADVTVRVMLCVCVCVCVCWYSLYIYSRETRSSSWANPQTWFCAYMFWSDRSGHIFYQRETQRDTERHLWVLFQREETEFVQKVKYRTNTKTRGSKEGVEEGRKKGWLLSIYQGSSHQDRFDKPGQMEGLKEGLLWVSGGVWKPGGVEGQLGGD